MKVLVPPDRPKIYHITHLENLLQMIDGMIWSDAARIRQNLGCKIVGMGGLVPCFETDS